MKQIFTAVVLWTMSAQLTAQTNPVITAFLQNNTTTGSYYTSGNSTAISNNILANCQMVQYNNTWSYISTKGIPSYPTGPFLDGNPSQASDQDAIYKLPLVPTQNTGTLTATTGGTIGIFINGVSLFDYRDGVAWNSSTNALCGGPGNPPCPGGPTASMDWNRDAIPAEKDGFDCSKGHPAMGNYHHHQNPSAFKLDKNVISTICNLYDADGLYMIDSTQHSPLIGFAYDGFPIYGAYAYANSNGTGGIVRMKSSYQLRNITQRTHHANGNNVDDGPAVSSTYFLGYFKEDYEYLAASGDLDEHNGRFCITPEYPNGIYCYFATVDANWNSAYPYVVGPTFYGNKVGSRVVSAPAGATTYVPTMSNLSETEFESMDLTVFPNPSQDFVAVQISGLLKSNLDLKLYDLTGKLVREAQIQQGSTLWYLDVQTLYNGTYLLKIANGEQVRTEKVIILR